MSKSLKHLLNLLLVRVEIFLDKEKVKINNKICLPNNQHKIPQALCLAVINLLLIQL